MSDEDAFIQAILADPGDNAARLVYADWLDERGDPRAEYLRRLCVRAEPANDSACARFREIDPEWRVLVQPPGPYAIVRHVARGTYTSLYEATHTHINLRGRRVILKF